MTVVESGSATVRQDTLAPGAAFHENLATSWSGGYARGSFRRRLRFLARRLDVHVRPNATWLDAGCGSGVLSRELAARGADVIAMDGSPAMLDAARGLATPAGQRIRYELVESIERMPVSDGGADGILCSSVLEYVASPAAALAEFHRVLRPGGILMLTVPNRFSLIRGVQSVARALGGILGISAFPYLAVSLHCYSRRSLRRALARGGFDVDEVSLFSPRLPLLLGPLGLGALWLGVARRRPSGISA